MKIRKVFIAALSVLSGLFSCPLLVFGQQTTLPKDKQNGAILHAFCWSFQTIKDNMKQIADAGFTMVQTSPANKCFVGDDGGLEIFGKGKWYYHYQPVEWTIGNYQLGSKADFIAMTTEARKYGITVLVDVLPNHTAFDTTAVTQQFIDAVGGHDQLYHANGLKPIEDYDDRLQCTTQGVGGLPDVNTENPLFQYYYMKYVNELIACGAGGFRYDTAKHIGLPSDPKDEKSSRNNFWEVATGREAVNGLRLDTSKELTGIHHAEIEVKDYGTIDVELDADTAPITVTNFVKLAQEGFYDGLTFHRIMDGFMIQGGDPNGDGTGGSEENIKGEFSNNGVDNDISHTRGTISMARASDPDSASSQFFIVQADSTFLDGDYAGFGHVTEGMDIVDKICEDAKPTDDNGTIPSDQQPVIEKITITD